MTLSCCLLIRKLTMNISYDYDVFLIPASTNFIHLSRAYPCQPSCMKYLLYFFSCLQTLTALSPHSSLYHILSHTVILSCTISVQHASLFTVNGRLVDAAFLRALNSPEIYLQRSASLGLACLYTVSQLTATVTVQSYPLHYVCVNYFTLQNSGEYCDARRSIVWCLLLS